MKKLLTILLFLFLNFDIFCQNVRLEYNPQTNTYPSRPNVQDRVTYVGWINPAELSGNGFRQGYDIWQIDLVRPQVTIDITSANIGTIQSIVDGLDATKINRLYFRATNGLATTFRNVTINCKAKHGLQLVGETDAQGNNLVTINGAIFLNTWTANSGKFRATVSDFNALVDKTADLQSYFYSGYLNVADNLLLNGIPLIAVGSIAEVTDDTKFFYDRAGGFVYLNSNPSANTVEWAQQESVIHCGATSANYPNATNGVAVSNLNFINHAGSSRAGVVGGRSYIYPTGASYSVGSAVSGWFVKNCTFNANAGISVYLHSRSTAYGNTVSNTGLISMHTVYPGTELGYSTNISTSFINNVIQNDNWRGMDSGYANGFKQVGQYKLLIRGNTIRNQGVIYWNRTIKCNGIWLDFCDADINNYSVIENNTVYNTTDNGMHIEATGYVIIRNNTIYDVCKAQIAPAPHGCIYVSTSNNLIAQNNFINPRRTIPSDAFEVKIITFKNDPRGNSLFTNIVNQCRNVFFKDNDYTMSNTSGGTLIEYTNGQTTTTPIYQWAINQRVQTTSNIFRSITAGTNFIQTGSSTDNLATFQGRNTTYFEVNSTIQ